MRIEQYKFCLDFYYLCDKYLKREKELNGKDDIERIKFFRELKFELEQLLIKGKNINNINVLINHDFYYAYDLIEMLYTYIDSIPENKNYLLIEVFAFISKYTSKIEENNSLLKWKSIVNNKEVENDLKKIKRKLIEILLITGLASVISFTYNQMTLQDNEDPKIFTLEKKK